MANVVPATVPPVIGAPVVGKLLVSRAVAILREHRAFVALSICAISLLLIATQGAWFFHDEWLFIRERSFADPGSWLLPHTQHFVALHAAVYTALLAAFGTSTYVPFLLGLFVAHVAFAASIYKLIDRHVGRGPAIAAATFLLFPGYGYLNLSWAFQMGAVGSVALAMWGLLVIRERPALASILMTVGIATSGFALFVLPAAALYGRHRRAVAASVVPVLAYAVWYVSIGRSAMIVYGDAPTVTGWLGWIPAGVMESAAAATGVGPLGAILIAGALLLVGRVADHRAAAVGIVAILTEYAILGLSRQGVNSPAGPQYVYFGAAFLLPVFATAWLAVPRWGRPAVALLVVVAVAANVRDLLHWSSIWSEYMAISDPYCLLCRGR